MRSLALSAIVLAASAAADAPAHAAQMFSCGGADVRIEVLEHQRRPPGPGVEAVVTVSRSGADTVLRYAELDFIGGQCLLRADAPPLIVFQAYCGGSGCKDLDNWGVVDPATLRVLIVPADGNRAAARHIVGAAGLPELTMMNVPPHPQPESRP